MKALDVDRAIDVINRQIESIEKQQLIHAGAKKGGKKSPLEATRLTSQVMTMARGVGSLLDALRKMGDEVDEQLKALTPERTAQLALRLVGKLSPEHRAAVALHIQELDGKLISHGG
jgi:Flp pilus assembly protein CpaB